MTETVRTLPAADRAFLMALPAEIRDAWDSMITQPIDHANEWLVSPAESDHAHVNPYVTDRLAQIARRLEPVTGGIRWVRYDTAPDDLTDEELNILVKQMVRWLRSAEKVITFDSLATDLIWSAKNARRVAAALDPSTEREMTRPWRI